MLVPDIINFFRGYLTVRVEGLKLEKFLNMAVIHGISIWNVKRVSLTVIELKLSIGGYRSIKRILKKAGCQLYIVDKDGFPFFMSKIKRRKMMLVGFIIFIFLLVMLSSFIWSVEIIGAKTISTKEIQKCLSELGVKPGAFKLDIAVSDVQDNMLIRMGNLSWIKVKLVGTRAEIEVKERIIPPKIIPIDKPCNIVAKRDGIIEKIVSNKGDVLVTKGEPVKKGQVLVTGVIDRDNAERRFVHSNAEAVARTWYEGTAAVPLGREEKIRSGNVKKNLYINVYSKKIQIKNSNIIYKSYDKIEKSTKLVDTDIFQLPIELVIEEFHETTKKKVTISQEEAKNEATDRVEKAIIDKLPPDAKIINKKINISIKDNIVIANALIETIEDIGIQEEIK